MIFGPFPETCGLDEDGFLRWLAESLVASTGKPVEEMLQTLREGVQAGLLVVDRRADDGAYMLSEDLEDAPERRGGGDNSGGAAPAAAPGGGGLQVVGGSSGTHQMGSSAHKRQSVDCTITVLFPLPSRLPKAA